ncbi:MAG: hypothetical protein AAGC97_14820, partial [Planctomycetota bacterium]
MPAKTTSKPAEIDVADGIVTVEVVPGGAVSGSIRPPGSKSITNRALLISALADPGPRD